MKFKEFLLLTESQIYLGEKIGDILTALHDLNDNGTHLGTRQLVKYADQIVDMIRRILHDSWPPAEKPFLKKLQKVGVAIAKSIEEKDNLEDTLQAATHETEQLLNKMGMPVNQLGSAEDNTDSKKNSLSEPQGKKPKEAPQPQPQADPQQQGQQPPMPQGMPGMPPQPMDPTMMGQMPPMPQGMPGMQQ